MTTPLRALATTGAVAASLAAAAPAMANQPPVTESDSYTLNSSTPALSVPPPGILANDYDPDGDPITAELLRPTDHGTLDLHADGSFTYTPASGFTGLDSFDYYARDSATSVSQCCGHVFITVTHAPIAHDDSYGALSGVARTVPAPGVLANDEGADRVRLATPPAHGTVDLRATGRFTYTSAPGFVGDDSFTYRAVVTGEPSSLATVSLRVKASNTRPRGVTDAYTTQEDVPLTVPGPGVLTNDSDADGDPLTALLDAEPRGEYFDLQPDGSFTYYPPPDFDSPVTFTYRVNDGIINSALTTATIEISAVNDPPYAEEDAYELGGGTHLEVPAPGVLGNDSDPVEGDGLVARWRSGPLKGTLDFRSDGSFTYDRSPGQVGRDRFRYQVRDSGGAIGDIVPVYIYP